MAYPLAGIPSRRHRRPGSGSMLAITDEFHFRTEASNADFRVTNDHSSAFTMTPVVACLPRVVHGCRHLRLLGFCRPSVQSLTVFAAPFSTRPDPGMDDIF